MVDFIRESGCFRLWWKLQFYFVLLAGLVYLARGWRVGLDARAFTPRAYEPGNEQ